MTLMYGTGPYSMKLHVGGMVSGVLGPQPQTISVHCKGLGMLLTNYAGRSAGQQSKL